MDGVPEYSSTRAHNCCGVPSPSPPPAPNTLTDLDPEAAGLGDGELLPVAPLDPQLASLLGDTGLHTHDTAAAAAGRRRGVAADIALEGGAYRYALSCGGKGGGMCLWVMLEIS
jgi:hypothetical protein